MTHEQTKQRRLAMAQMLQNGATREEVTKKFSVSIWTLRLACLESGVPFLKDRKPSKVWDGQDWSKSNAEIALERGISRQAVHAARNLHARRTL